MATLGAELGCERYLASTVVTGSGQRSSTCLAKLRRGGILVLALRAFHLQAPKEEASQMHCEGNVAHDRRQGRCSPVNARRIDKSCAAVTSHLQNSRHVESVRAYRLERSGWRFESSGPPRTPALHEICPPNIREFARAHRLT